jgi:hypothetical protein
MNKERLLRCGLCDRPIQECHCFEVPEGTNKIKEKFGDLRDYV